MDKEAIIANLQQAHQQLWDATLALPESLQIISLNGKWSALENIQHITKGSGGVARFLHTDKAILASKFGQTTASSRGYEQIVALYHDALGPNAQTTPQFAPDSTPGLTLSAEIDQGKLVIAKLFGGLENWSEKELDHQICPHPRLGPLTLREMLHFTTYHALHHLKAVDRISSN